MAFKSMSELYEEYKFAIEVQNGVIEDYKKALKQARSDGNYRDVKHLCSLLRVLYMEKGELIERLVFIFNLAACGKRSDVRQKQSCS